MPRWFVWFAIAMVAAIWWLVGAELFDRVDRSVEAGLPEVARVAGMVFAVVVRLVMAAIEARFYVSWWRLQSRSLPFLPTMTAVLILSLFDAAGSSLRWWAEDHQLAGALGVALLTGIGDLLAAPLGKSAALAGVGVLGLARVVLTAGYQSTVLRIGFGKPAAVTMAAWIACRLLGWWTSDLFRGMSPGAGS